MRNVIIGIIIIIVVAAGGIIFKVVTNSPEGMPVLQGKTGSYTFAVPEPISVPPLAGYKIDSITLDGETLPLITVPLDNWGGYAALFASNNGTEPNKNSLFYKKGKFVVKLIYIESSTEQMNGYASGKYPIIWAGMDSLPLIYDAFHANKDVAPKVLGLFDWSNTDGILVKNKIKTPEDFRGKIIITSSNVPYSFFLLWYLAQYNISASDVKILFETDTNKALEIFKNDSSVAGWIVWEPYISDIISKDSKYYMPDARLLISSKDANQLIADTFIARSDFIRDNPDIAQIFFECVMEANDIAKNSATQKIMADFYKVPQDEAAEMLKDIHLSNYAENKMFFDYENPIGAYGIFLLAQNYYKDIGIINKNVSYEPESVLTLKFINDAAANPVLKNQTNRMLNSFNKSAVNTSTLEHTVLTNTANIAFDIGKDSFDIKSSDPQIKENMKILSNIAQQAKFLSTTYIILEGHLDTSREAEFKAKGLQEYNTAKAQAKISSKKRAEFVKSILVNTFNIDSDRIDTRGLGWENPIDPDDPQRNRRVEVKFFSLE